MRFGAALLAAACVVATAGARAEPQAARLSISVRGKPCSALLLRPDDARALLVLAHGQVMDIEHPFMVEMSAALARRGIATLRFNFPYAEAKRERPDGMPLLVDALEAAARAGEQQRAELPLLVGGKSAGAMVAAQASSEGRVSSAAGIVILGYPLHAPGRPSAVNAHVLERVAQPMLLVQGTRDPLADLSLVRPLAEKLAPKARLHVVQGADHAFAPPSEGAARSQADIYEEIAGAVAGFAATLAASSGG
jgi:predicted alpha/beta-hydrolase family hydrolase